MPLKQIFRKLLSPLVVGNCLGVTGTLVALFLLALCAVQCYTRHGDDVVMPNLRGQSIETAMNKIEALGLRAEVSDTGYVERYPGDIVLDQGIDPGERIKVGRLVTLIINSREPRMLTLPAVIDNCSRREAEVKLRVMGFQLGEPEMVQGDKDWVYGVKAGGRTLRAGERVSAKAQLTLQIGVGEEEVFNGDDSLENVIFAPEREELSQDPQTPQE